ncbi:MAG: alpha-L-glutamate ligase [Deltaproteobacteria bacterium]|nr:alpha-L-glutamate ligase [Deltaproteobacteria bacterium]HCH62360.1 alpha-L-glutamate ligase [Deltaproteobacteria bacterium]
MPSLPPVHILFENPDWLPPLLDALEREGFDDVRLVELNEGLVDPNAVPPDGIWINRISPSSHTRGHDGTVQLGREVLFWLEAHGRRVLNGLAAFELEMSKFRQDILLRRWGIQTPKTVLAIGRTHILAAAEQFDGPFITKHNQGGKGLGIRRFDSIDALAAYLDSEDFDEGPDRKVILQQYIDAPEPFITRVEIVGGQFVYAMRSDTSSGFELCPSDACQLPTGDAGVCPADGAGSKFAPSPLEGDDPLVLRFIAMCQGEGIDLAGIEFIEDRSGQRYTYDINGTTNYSGVFGRQIGVDGMSVLARHIRTVVVPALGPLRRVA